MADRTIFRDAALEAYRRRTNRDVVPRVTSWPIIVCLWLLVALLLGAAAVAWSVRVPTYISASGVMLAGGDNPAATGGMNAALFVPAQQSTRLRVGEAVRAQIGSAGGYAAGKIVVIQSGVVSPDEARSRYRLGGATDVITEPSRVVIVALDEAPRSTDSGGSRLVARIQVGSQPILALFPGLGKLFGGAG